MTGLRSSEEHESMHIVCTALRALYGPGDHLTWSALAGPQACVSRHLVFATRMVHFSWSCACAPAGLDGTSIASRCHPSRVTCGRPARVHGVHGRSVITHCGIF